MDNSLSGSSVHGILKTRILEWVAIFPSGDFSHPGIELMCLTSPELAVGFFTNSATWEAENIQINDDNIYLRKKYMDRLLKMCMDYEIFFCSIINTIQLRGVSQ